MRWAELSEVLGSIQADAELAKDLSATADVSAHAVARSRRRRELLLGLVAVVVLGAALELTLLVQDRPPSGWTNIEERKLSISAEYPNAWHHQRFDHQLGLLAIRRGIVLSNVRHRFRYPDLGPRPRYIRVEHECPPFRRGGHGDLPDTAFPHDLSRNGTLPAITR